eukprot:5734362-Prymnesium_polylepis.1
MLGQSSGPGSWVLGLGSWAVERSWVLGVRSLAVERSCWVPWVLRSWAGGVPHVSACPAQTQRQTQSPH